MQPHHKHLFLSLERTRICKSELQWALLCEERLGAEGLLLFHVYAAKLELEVVSGAGGKALETWAVVENQGTLWHAVAPLSDCPVGSGSLAPEHRFVGSVSTKQVPCHRGDFCPSSSCSLTAPGSTCHEDLPAPIPCGLGHLAVAVDRQTWIEGTRRVLELNQVTSMRLRCCQALFNLHLGPVPNAPGAGPAFSAT